MTKQLEEWIDYMEGEADLNLMAKLGFLLEHSARDREILQNLMRVRQLIELSDPALEIHEFIDDAAYLEHLHARTMSKIKKNEVQVRDRRGSIGESRREAEKETEEASAETSSSLD